LERKTLDLSAKLGDFAIKRQATWGMSDETYSNHPLHKAALALYLVVQGLAILLIQVSSMKR
jgi:hypothetical protein